MLSKIESWHFLVARGSLANSEQLDRHAVHKFASRYYSKWLDSSFRIVQVDDEEVRWRQHTAC